MIILIARNRIAENELKIQIHLVFFKQGHILKRLFSGRGTFEFFQLKTIKFHKFRAGKEDELETFFCPLQLLSSPTFVISRLFGEIAPYPVAVAP